MPQRFVDASVFVHAYIRPRRQLRPHERQIKAHARSIVRRINDGEDVVTSCVHLLEIANLLENWMPLEDAREILSSLAARGNVEVLPVERRDLLAALAVGADANVGASDALAAVLMRAGGIAEVYSFDRDFDRFEDLHRISQ
ncbi:MAG: type II toxin-antitoxin system VapC family toxin [Candidatus Thermoplasmatota archaeon]